MVVYKFQYNDTFHLTGANVHKYSCKKYQDHNDKLIIMIITVVIKFMDEDMHLWAMNCQACGSDDNYMSYHSASPLLWQLVAYFYIEWILYYMLLNLFSLASFHPCILHLSAASQLLTNVGSRYEICTESHSKTIFIKNKYFIIIIKLIFTYVISPMHSTFVSSFTVAGKCRM